MTSFSFELRRKILRMFPYTWLVSTPGGWAECGGMNRYKAMGFSYSTVSSLPSGWIVMFMSRKVEDKDRSENSHSRPSSSFASALKAVQLVLFSSLVRLKRKECLTSEVPRSQDRHELAHLYLKSRQRRHQQN